jgi:opacity protein-like surface antigen
MKEGIMKRVSILFCVLFIIILSFPVTGLADGKKGGYAILKAGAFFPTEDLEDADFDSSFNGELVLGTYYNPNLALECAIGYYQTDRSVRFQDVKEEDDLFVVPITANIKGVLPLNGVELYGGAGFGVYIVHIDADVSGPDIVDISDDDDSDAVLGAQVMAGVNVDISRKIFLGVEAKYIFTDKADLFNSEINLDGLIVTGNIGYRF